MRGEGTRDGRKVLLGGKSASGEPSGLLCPPPEQAMAAEREAGLGEPCLPAGPGADRGGLIQQPVALFLGREPGKLGVQRVAWL